MHRFLIKILALFSCLSCGYAADGLPPQVHEYNINIAEDLSRMDVVACFDTAVPHYLVAGTSGASKYLDYMEVEIDGRTRSLVPEKRRVNLPQVPNDRCVRYGVRIDDVADVRKLNVGLRAGDSVMLALDYWLWRPEHIDATTKIELQFELHDGMAVSGPWPEQENSTANTVFLLDQTPYYWIGCIAVGKVHRSTVEVPGAKLRLAMMDGLTREQQTRARNWMTTAANAVNQLYGEFPLPNPQIIIIPWPDGNDASPFARVARGGGTAAHFLMNLSATQSEFDDDWVAVHELSHMFLPFSNREDAWLSEGIASYYQNILRARAGLVSPLDAWQKLNDGFGRGNRNTRDSTLASATRRMGPDGNYMRVYWSGAAMALLADVELRRISDGELSLDVALHRFKDCCLDSTRAWSGKEVMEKLDQLTATTTFTELYHKHVHSRFFPNLRPVFKQLGIESKDNVVSLDDTAPLADIRDSITATRAADVTETSLPTN